LETVGGDGNGHGKHHAGAGEAWRGEKVKFGRKCHGPTPERLLHCQEFSMGALKGKLQNPNFKLQGSFKFQALMPGIGFPWLDFWGRWKRLVARAFPPINTHVTPFFFCRI
jgi:hypothetical protein